MGGIDTLRAGGEQLDGRRHFGRAVGRRRIQIGQRARRRTGAGGGLARPLRVGPVDRLGRRGVGRAASGSVAVAAHTNLLSVGKIASSRLGVALSLVSMRTAALPRCRPHLPRNSGMLLTLTVTVSGKSISKTSPTCIFSKSFTEISISSS